MAKRCGRSERAAAITRPRNGRGAGRIAALLLGILLAVPSAAAVELQGHRGARGLLPENTLPGFERALDLGVDVLELDVGVTRDGVVVIAHDRALSPDLTRCNGEWIARPVPIVDLAYAEFRDCDVGRARPGSRTARRFPDQQARDGTPIPRLADLFALVAARGELQVGFNIETKLSPLAPGETLAPQPFAERLARVIRDHGMAARTVVQSFDWRTLVILRRIAPEIRTAHLSAERRWLDNVQRGRPGASPWLAGLDIDDHGGSLPRAVKALGGAIWSPYHRDATPAAIAEAHGLGLRVVVWTVNRAEDLRRALALGVDGIITDYPDRATTLLNRR